MILPQTPGIRSQHVVQQKHSHKVPGTHCPVTLRATTFRLFKPLTSSDFLWSHTWILQGTSKTLYLLSPREEGTWSSWLPLTCLRSLPPGELLSSVVCCVALPSSTLMHAGFCLKCFLPTPLGKLLVDKVLIPTSSFKYRVVLHLLCPTLSPIISGHFHRTLSVPSRSCSVITHSSHICSSLRSQVLKKDENIPLFHFQHLASY